MKDKLQPLRSKIDEIDTKLVRLLNERTKLVLEIGKIKHVSGGEIYAPDREEAVLRSRDREERGTAAGGFAAGDLPRSDVERAGAGETAGDRLPRPRGDVFAHGGDQEVRVEPEVRAVAEHHGRVHGSFQGPGRLRRGAD